ncbi:hypothetical protein ACT4MK_00110 (plasmid) [Bradyrhizobium barranii]|uniref:hypothetical protein n=1 Tax=Bradyrhizobium TaxID=374 RepID=UPI00339733DF
MRIALSFMVALTSSEFVDGPGAGSHLAGKNLQYPRYLRTQLASNIPYYSKLCL